MATRVPQRDEPPREVDLMPPTKDLKFLGDTERMRPSVDRTDFGYADPIGVYPLADGRQAWVTWLYDTATHDHVIVWIPGDVAPGVVEHVARVSASVESEKILKELES